ncbi:MAG TPA: hypothetical protein VFE50_00425 [Cyclobacteriaceae bacterium]|nr:hypothetical protein [Cyclobacteriaceae bacterium]
MHKTLGGAHFQRDTVYLSHRHVAEILSVDPEATNEFKIATKNYRVGGIMGFSGAILLAIPLVSAFSGGEPEWIMAGAGAALMIGSIPFSRGFKNHAEAAIEGYNTRHEPASQTRLYFNGSGITLKF